MNRQLPFLLGKGDREAATKHVETALFYTIVVAMLVFAVLIAGAWIIPGSGDPLSLSITTLAIYATSNLYSAFNEATFRGSGTFRTLGRLMLGQSLLGLALTVLVQRYGYTGHCVRLIIISVIYACITHYLRPLNTIPRFNWSSFRSLMSVGIPLFVQNYLGRVSLSAGPTLLAWLGGTTALGLFAPVNAVISTFALVPNALMSFVSAQQHYNYGRDGSGEESVKRVVSLSGGLMLSAAPFAAVAILLLPALVRKAAPQYVTSIAAMQLAVLIGVARVFNVATTAYATLAAWKEMFRNQASLWIGHVLGAGIGALVLPETPWLGVTWGLLIAYLIYIPITLRSLHLLANRAGAQGAAMTAPTPDSHAAV